MIVGLLCALLLQSPLVIDPTVIGLDSVREDLTKEGVPTKLSSVPGNLRLRSTIVWRQADMGVVEPVEHWTFSTLNEST